MTRILALLLFALIIPSVAAAQAPSMDTQLWFEAGLQLRATKRLRINVSQKLRISARDSVLDSTMTQVAPSYEALKFLRFEAGYRFIYGKDGERDELEYWHRFFAGANLRADLNPVRLELRLQYQEQIRFEGEDKHEHTERTRARATWSIGQTKLFGSFELFVRLAGNEPLAAQKWRTFLGASYGFGNVELAANLGYEAFFEQDRSALIAGLSFEADLDLR